MADGVKIFFFYVKLGVGINWSSPFFLWSALLHKKQFHPGSVAISHYKNIRYEQNNWNYNDSDWRSYADLDRLYLHKKGKNS